MSSTQHLYPPTNRPEGSVTAPVSAMAQKLTATAERFKAMTEAAIEESKAQPPPAESKGPEPVVKQVNWDEEVDREALVMRRRQPTDWLPTEVVVGATAVQLVPYRLNRKSVSITNTGANPVLLGATEGAVNNSTSNTYSLAAGGVLSLETEAAIWGSSSSGSTVVAIETYYSRQALGRAVASLMMLARARVGLPKEANVPVPPPKQGEKGLL